MPEVGNGCTEISTGFEAIEEALRGANPQNIVQQLQHAFRIIIRMNNDELTVAAQTLRAMAAMDQRFSRHPAVLSLANAVRLEMRERSTQNFDLHSRFYGAWNHSFSFEFKSI